MFCLIIRNRKCYKLSTFLKPKFYIPAVLLNLKLENPKNFTFNLEFCLILIYLLFNQNFSFKVLFLDFKLLSLSLFLKSHNIIKGFSTISDKVLYFYL